VAANLDISDQPDLRQVNVDLKGHYCEKSAPIIISEDVVTLSRIVSFLVRKLCFNVCTGTGGIG
jgi:hypothetical protein